MKTRKIYLIVITLAFLSSCMVGPNFQKVAIETPENYTQAENAKVDTVLNLKWWQLFNDPVLVKLIDSALVNNRNLLMAASRIEEARIYLGYTKADNLPQINYSGGLGYGNENGRLTGGAAPSFSATANISWEIDFWGKYRRATEAARAELLANEYALNIIQVGIICEVSNAYYDLLDFKRRLQISERTLESRVESTRIIRERFEKGTVPEIDLNQAQIQEAIAARSIPTYKRYIAFSENALRVLLGENPQSFTVNSSIDEQVLPPEIPFGLPSQLLERRPDILAAEQQVVAQNARIGVAQAMRFPSISLTALGGAISPDLTNFNATNDIIGSVGAGLFGPVFNFGKNKRRVQMEEERTNQMRLNYEQTVLYAFREVEDALVNINTLEAELEKVEDQLAAAQNAAKLSRMRYDGGVTSYLEVLETERSLFQVELYHSEMLQRRLASYTGLYKALGGGWIQKQ